MKKEGIFKVDETFQCEKGLLGNMESKALQVDQMTSNLCCQHFYSFVCDLLATNKIR